MIFALRLIVGVIFYLIIGVIGSILYCVIADDNDEQFAGGIIFAWPIISVMAIGIYLYEGLVALPIKVHRAVRSSKNRSSHGEKSFK